MEGLRELQNSVSILQKELSDLKRKTSLEDIILNSEYKILAFQGNANGTALNHCFDDSIFKNKRMLIKGLQFFPYYVNDSIDISLSDGVTTTQETIPAGGRMNRVLDIFTNFSLGAHFCSFVINGQANILNTITTGVSEPGAIPPDFSVDNIFYLVKSIVTSIDIILNTEVFETLITPGTAMTPNIKAYLECYVF